VTLPGMELVADKQAEEIFIAIRDAFDAAERQVEAFVERRRGFVKSPASSPEGEVVRIFSEEGFGFLTAPDGREVYFHRNAVLDPPGFDKLAVGSRVRFAEEQGLEGPQASSVSLVETNGKAAPLTEIALG
jgi:cold shock CspA family protein